MNRNYKSGIVFYACLIVAIMVVALLVVPKFQAKATQMKEHQKAQDTQIEQLLNEN